MKTTLRQSNPWRRLAVLVAVAVLAAAPAAVAQEQTGNLYGTVTGGQEDLLPDVSVELTGLGAPRTQHTGDQGEFRFLNLDPGTYRLTASLNGYSTVKVETVDIRVGHNTTLEVELQPAIDEVIIVYDESPLLDPRKVDRGTTVSQVELEKIPTARDPWAVVTQTPGVLSDRINVGGNESGQQAVFTAPGTTDSENSFAVDGVVITDMAAVGSSPTYYDFDQFKEIQVSTGGTDVEKISAGASLNLVTKRGSNDPRGSGRYLLTEAGERFGLFEQGSPDIQDELETGDGSGGCDARINPDCEQTLSGTPGNRTDELLDVGFEAGGPIVRDRLWIWGSYGRNDIQQQAQTGDPDNTLLENSALKLNGQVSAANSIVGAWNRGDKIKDGRRPGSNFALEATWDQDGPTEIWKIEDTHVVTSDLYVSGSYSYVDGGFNLTPKGGTFADDLAVTEEALLDVDGTWKNTYLQATNDRNSETYQVDGSYFFTTGGVSHELKSGVYRRSFETVTRQAFPGRGVGHLTCEAIGTCGLSDLFPSLPGDDVALVVELAEAPVEQDYTAVWLGDTLTRGDWTLNLGMRYDLQDGRNLPASVAAHEAFPELLPARSFDGNDAGFEWETVSPRLGLTYALGEERRTLLRVSVARFPEQLETADVTQVNPLGVTVLQAFYDDADGNNFFDPGEETLLNSVSGIDPNDPGGVETPNEVDPGLEATLTDEIVLGIEHAFRPELVVGVDLIWRNVHEVLVTRDFIVDESGTKRLATVDDYRRVLTIESDGGLVPHLPDGTPWSADVYGYREGIENAGGTLLTNGDSERDYLGASISFTKRLSNRWLARGYFQYGEADWSFGDQDRLFDNPTDEVGGFDGSADHPDGDLFVVQSGGSGAFQNVFIQSTWSANLNGVYQVAPERPWGFNVAGNLLAREGFPALYGYTQTLPQGLGDVFVAATDSVDQFRNEDVVTLDLRLEKDMRFTDRVSGILSLDAFNVTNETYVLSRDVNLDTPQANFVTQSLSPRIYRLGFRINWR